MDDSPVDRLSRILDGDPSIGHRSMPCKNPDEHGKPWHCCCISQVLVKVKMINGTIGIKWSCSTCGADGSQWLPLKSISPEVFGTLPFRDEALKDVWREQQSKRVASMIRSVDLDEAKTARQRAYQEFMDSLAWRVLRNKRLQLDGYICQDCGGSAVTAHHIYYPEEGSWEETPLWCLVSLCRACHAKAHRIFPPGSAPWSTARSYQAANEEES